MEARIDHFSTWIPDADHEKLRTQIHDMLVEAEFTVLNFMQHHFEPEGYTALWLLAESHCALHTFPEENKSYIELSSCNTEMYINFITIFKVYLKNFENEIQQAQDL